MPPYAELFPVGTRVQVVPRSRLQDFHNTWRYHHPLQTEQLSFAGHQATVSEVAFYHGGDVLYTLSGIPGLWHECCIHAPDDSTRNI